jgi:hypothetical protein
MIQCKKMRAALVAALTAIVIAACLVTTTRAQPSGEHVRGRAYLFYGLIPAIDWGMDELHQSQRYRSRELFARELAQCGRSSHQRLPP